MNDKVGNIVERLREQHKCGIIGLPENWLYVHYGEAADLIQSQQSLIEEMSGALEISKTALNDWLNIHASDECDPLRVIEAKGRIGEYGTIGYIAEVTGKISGVLAKSDQTK